MMTGKRIDRVAQVRQAALLGFLVPFLGVVVAVEEDLLALLEDAGQQVLDRLVAGPCRLATAFSRLVAMKSSDSATMVFSTVLGPAIDCEAPTARNSNLLPVKANGLVRLRSPASLRQLRQHRDADLHEAALLGALRLALLELIDDVLQLVAEEDRDDGRRGFVGAEAVIVGGAGDGDAQQLGILGHGADDGDAEDQELGVVVRRVAGVEQVLARCRWTSTSCCACRSR